MSSLPPEPPAPPELDVRGGEKDADPPSVNVKELSPLQKSGLELAKMVLTMICGLALILVLFVAVGEYGRSSPEVMILDSLAQKKCANSECFDAATLESVERLLDKVAESRRTQREFWTTFSQFLLMNLLLPVLTAILGYVFGTNQKKDDSSA